MQRRSTNENDAAYGQSRRRVMSGPGGLIAHRQQATRASSHLLVVAGLGFTVLAALLPRFATSLSLRTLLTSVRRHDIVYRRWCCVRDSPSLTMVSQQVAATGTNGTTRFAQVQAVAPCARLSNHGNRLARPLAPHLRDARVTCRIYTKKAICAICPSPLGLCL